MKLNAQFGNVRITADAEHPNKMKFRGVLVRINEASTKPPGGAQGHKIYIPADVAARQLHTLIGMGLNYSPNLDAHDQRRKVGVIDKAWIEGKDVCVSGVIWKHDFPEAERDLKQPGLGMSMELVDVSVENPDANVWTLKDFHFSGATILYREAAAYYRTQAIAAKADQRSIPMTKVAKKAPAKKQPTTAEVIATIAAAAAARIVTDVVTANNKTVTALLSRQTKSIGALAAAQIVLTKHVAKIDTAAVEDGDDTVIEAADDEEMEAAKKQEEMDPEDEADGGDDEDVEAATEDGDIEVGDLEELQEAEGVERPGHQNEDASNKGSTTTLNDKVGPTVSASAFNRLKKQVEKLTSDLAAAKANETKLAHKLETQEQQLTAASDRTARRSLPADALGLLAKAHINPADLFATGQRLSVEELDAVLHNFNAEQGHRLTPTDRITLKNHFTAAGLLDEGRVERGRVH